MVPMAPSSTCTRPSPIRSRRVGMSAVIVQVRSQPTLDVLHIHALPARIILHLVSLDLADTEVLGLRPPEVVPAHRRSGEHSEALRQGDTHLGFGVEQVEEQALFGVIGTRRIARRGPDALIALLDQPLIIERLVPGVAPELLAHPLM